MDPSRNVVSQPQITPGIPGIQPTRSQSIESLGIATLDTFPERRILFEEEQMAKGRAERHMSEEHALGPGDVPITERSSLIRPIDSPICTPTPVSTIPSETIPISSGIPGMVVYGGGPAAPSQPGTSGTVINMGAVRTTSGGGGVGDGLLK